MDYISKEHAEIKRRALKYWTRKPDTPEEAVEYAEYHLWSKDYGNAAKWYAKAASDNVPEACYEYGYLLWNGMGVTENKKQAESFFQRFIQSMKDKENQRGIVDGNNIFRLAMCYGYGFGTPKDSEKAHTFLEEIKEDIPEAQYQIGIAYRDGLWGYPGDRVQAEYYFRKAYDNCAEEAIFASYNMFEGKYEQYPYKEELTMAYSYRIGKCMRAAHVSPCVESYQNLVDLYQHGFPGDTGEADIRFRQKAEKYQRKIEELRDKTEQ